MSEAIQSAAHSTQNIQSSSSQMGSEEAANYIWTDLLGQLQHAYNSQIVQIQQENINDVAKMQRLIQELGVKYQKEVQEISNAYNAVRVPGATASDINSAIEHAKEAIEAMGAKPEPESPEQKQAKEIDQKTNEIVQHNKDEYNQIASQLQKVQSAIESNEALIAELETKIAELQKSDPEKAAKASEQLSQAKKELEELKAQAQDLSNQMTSLEDVQNQINSKDSEINSLIQAIMNGENPAENLKALQAAFEQLQQIDGNSSSTVSSISQKADAAVKASEELSSFLKSIDVTKSGGVDPKPDPTPWSSHGQEAYFDMGSFPIWSLMDYSNPDYPNGVIDPAKFSAYLNSLFDQMKAAGVNQIDLAFGQFGSISDMLALAQWDGKDINDLPESVRNSTDIFTSMMRDYPYVGTNGEISNGFSQFIELAKENGLKIDLSIGGELAGAATIAKDGETPAGQAEKLVQLMDILGIDRVDFDLENAAIVQQNSTEELREYFTKVHELLSAEGKESILTTMGSIPDWVSSPDNPGTGFFHDMFYGDNGESIFNDMFDGLNLMLYGGTTSYLDVNGKLGWGIDDWLDVIGKENASKIHIGFEDGVDYSNAASNQGTPFDIRPGSTSGEAAAQIFNQIKEKLAAEGYSSDLGAPFWWPQKDQAHGERYAPKSDGTIDFKLDEAKDFWNELNKLEGLKGAQAEAKKTEDLVAMYRSMGAA